ncbi:hypothetical protein E2C01_061213 [Portunus trituberculatus]|uniref:Uncharacterized protein n=1 Tax=Portunus trituberculatus TaxID=210409 RepID=A0A5B7H397_PORTR|nr:hypothetical protein [Portunus trituberculatus]
MAGDRQTTTHASQRPSTPPTTRPYPAHPITNLKQPPHSTHTSAPLRTFQAPLIPPAGLTLSCLHLYLSHLYHLCLTSVTPVLTQHS